MITITCAGMLSVTSASATSVASLLVSSSSSRTAAVALTGQQLSGSRYVFVTAPASSQVRQVTFYLDGKLFHTESGVPWDMAGGTETQANPLNVSVLPAGTHVVMAAVRLPSRTVDLKGTFVTASSSTATTTTTPTPSPTSSPSPAPAPTSAPSPSSSPSPSPTSSAPSSPSPSPSPVTTTTGTTATATTSFDPVHFDWSSVGGPNSGLTAFSGTTLTLSTAGQMVDHVSTAAGQKTVAQATASGVSNCVLGDNFNATAESVKMSHCTADGGVNGAGSYTLQDNFITSDGDGIDPTGAGYKVIEYNKIWRDGTRVGTKHEDGIQFWQGGNALVHGNWISGWQTSAMMVKADLGPISNVTIDSNYLNNPTGYYQLYLCPASYGLSNITVTNNAFGKSSFIVSTCSTKLTFVHTESQRQAAIAAGNQAATRWIVWNNNYIAGTTTVVAPPGGWAE